MATETEAVIEEREREREGRYHQANLKDAANDGLNPQQMYETMLEDIVKTSLNEGSKKLLKNLLTRDFVLAYLTRAELNEFKWKLRVKKELFYAMHPDERCAITGEDRKFINDDSNDGLLPLTDVQVWEVENVFDGIWMRVTRSVNGKQWDAINTTIRESRLGNGPERESSGGWLSRLRR